MRPVWRIGQYSNFASQITRRSYQITSQTRWHPLAPDKTFLQLKGFDKIPTDNRNLSESPHHNAIVWHPTQVLEPIKKYGKLKSINKYFKSTHCGNITVYLDRIHQYLCAVKFL